MTRDVPVAGETDDAVLERLTAEFDHLDRALTVDRSREVCRRLREQPGVSHTPAHGGYFVLTRYADVIEAQRQAGRTCPVFSYSDGALHPRLDRPKAIPIDFDGAEHAEYRKLFMDILNRRAVEGFETELREEIDRVVTDFLTRGTGDFSAEVARRLPIAVIGRLIGWSSAVSEQIGGLVEEMMAGFHSDGRPPARDQLLALCQREVDDRRREPRDDYLTTLLRTTVFGRALTDDELTNTLLTFIFGGYETTAAVIGNLMVRLAGDEALQALLRREPELIAPAIEESIRLQPPVHVQFRTVTAEVEMDDTVLPEGSRVAVSWVSANNDPAQFDAPDQFRLDRPNGRKHVGFGFGVHLCAGIHLARLELVCLFEELLGRGYRYEFAGTPVHSGLMIAHDAGWAELPIRCVAL